ncbi:DUF983 domain-containing protein [Phenylobacterium sp.]|uniref:DUF983 domain-containing protein n=1 Tax=Phenylobacterium sp. TaxID=1871053 RepID=UPI00391A615A
MAEIVHPLARSIFRGVRHRCPSCGEGRLFWRYLKVQTRCERCDHALDQYPADDGPAYVTILLTGHLIVAPLLLFPIVWEADARWSAPIILGSMTALILALLPRVKGGWIGLMYALGVNDRDARLHTADAAD